MEHVIPKWLIKATGDLKRDIGLGSCLNSNNDKERTFPFDNFKFPACTACNDAFSKLESTVCYIMGNVLKNCPVSREEINCLLNWFDKVRIGIWLGFLYLDKNFFDIEPKFHIQSRLATDDRLLYIYKAKTAPRGVNFLGHVTPAFCFSPSCFVLRVNEFFFFNASFQFLCAKGLGFPFARSMEIDQDGRFEIDLKPGTEKIKRPVIKWPSNDACLEIYQPIFVRAKACQNAMALYENEYVKKNSLDFSNCIGSIYWDKNDGIELYPENSNAGWLNIKEHDFNDLIKILWKQTLDFQNNIHNMASFENLKGDEGRETRKIRAAILKFNKEFKTKTEILPEWSYE